MRLPERRLNRTALISFERRRKRPTGTTPRSSINFTLPSNWRGVQQYPGCVSFGDKSTDGKLVGILRNKCLHVLCSLRIKRENLANGRMLKRTRTGWWLTLG
ncbi:hypothetical protein HNY73_001229 [Argiope bruennichi]|uniref:Uncharacterized protein n=1 Tax=Argiope bruennichi TaxID=94029 RepID=A0A8T0G4D1_ARGBR|nr:hypothetical protein HNY73_001229 [Argiope bruennichi]